MDEYAELIGMDLKDTGQRYEVRGRVSSDDDHYFVLGWLAEFDGAGIESPPDGYEQIEVAYRGESQELA